ncbi:MAG: hypothetical protein IPI58_09785 [Alphaproteobacteria bacterium]|nr:MAG: hypothetical protein IPI58_09785 [Alphaproteobacteria bacterium]
MTIHIQSISRAAVEDAVSQALRQSIGPRREYGYDEAAAILDVERRTLEAWVLGQQAPCLYKFLRLAAWLGPEFVNHVLRLAGLDGASRSGTAAAPDDLHLNKDVGRLICALGDALSDGHVDHLERPNVANRARHLHAELGDWLTQHDHTAARGK